MNKTVYCLLLISFFFCSATLAQTPCGTASPTIAQARSLARVDSLVKAKSKTARSAAVSYVAVRPFIVRQNDGSGGLAVSTLNKVVNELNQQFAPSGIQFYILGDKYYFINSRQYYYFDQSDEEEFGKLYDVNNAINLYFVGFIDSPLSGILGYANFPLGRPVLSQGNISPLQEHSDKNTNRLFIAADVGAQKEETLIEKTVPHEMGHYFNLYHTFGIGNTGELVNGSNCSVAGDLVCDTPADYFEDRGSGVKWKFLDICLFSSGYVDANGQRFRPQTNNLMSYYIGCGNKFTQGQYGRLGRGYQIRSVENPDISNRYYIDGKLRFSYQLSQSSACVGGTFNANFWSFGEFNSGNTFKAQLLYNGNYYDLVTSASGSSVRATVPEWVGTGTYSVRIVSTSPYLEASTTNLTISQKPTPPAIQGYKYCQNQITVPLSATGTAIRWYNDPGTLVSTTVAPTPSSAQSGRQRFYATQTVNGCESARSEIYVDTDPIPVIPIVTAVGFCQNQPATALTASGQSLRWYEQETGGTGNNQAPVLSTQTIGSQTFYVSQTVGNCESPRAKLTATVSPAPDAPKVANPNPVCQFVAAPTLIAQGQTLRWYTQAEGGTVSSQIVPATDLPGTRSYFVSQTVSGCESPRARTDVRVKALPTATMPRDTAIIRYDSLRVQIALTGDAPWRVTLWNGQEISVSQSPAAVFIKPTTSTSYAVQKVVNECGPGNSGQAMRISLLEPLGVANQAESIKLKAYPNPTNAEVYVEWTATAGQRVQLRLLNISSNILERRTVRSNGALQTELIDLSNLPAGIYIIQLLTKSGEFSERLLKR